MFINKSPIALLIFVVSLCLGGMWKAAHAQDNFSSVAVFGDSLSDNGNLAATATPTAAILLQPPYNNGRVTNGLTAVEVLANTLSLPLLPAAQGGTNFAVAGATARGQSPADLTAQVDQHLALQTDSIENDALYIIFIGGNDIRHASRGGERFGRVLTNRAITNIYRAVDKLINAGARRLMIINAPDIGEIPETRLREAAGDIGLVRKAHALTIRFNTNLERITKRLEAEHNLDIVLLDLFSFNQNLRENTNAIGLSNDEDPCFVQTQSGAMYHPECEGGSGFANFAFFDAIHPTAAMHERLGRALYALVPAVARPVGFPGPPIRDVNTTDTSN